MNLSYPIELISNDVIVPPQYQEKLRLHIMAFFEEQQADLEREIVNQLEELLGEDIRDCDIADNMAYISEGAMMLDYKIDDIQEMINYLGECGLYISIGKVIGVITKSLIKLGYFE